MEAWAQELLNGILEELLEQEFKHFKIRLAEGPQKIPRGKTEKLDHLELTKLMIQHYKPIEALNVAVNCLEKIKRRDLSDRLQKDSQNIPVIGSPPLNGTSEQTAEAEKVELWSYLKSLAAQLHDIITISPDHDSAGHHSNQLEKIKGTTQEDGYTIFNDCINLKWVEWDGKIPDGAVTIENQYLSRTDYVAKINHSSGYYTPSKGPFCFYSLSDKELQAPSFQILVNGGNFERLEWKPGSWGSVPSNSIRCHPDCNTFVGKNKYGLGKVVTHFSAFFLPCQGKEYCYKQYDVLTICKDYHTENISNVQYKMDEGIAEYGQLSILDESIMENRSSLEAKRSATFQKETPYQHSWVVDHSLKPGVSVRFTAHFPITTSDKKGGIELHETSQGAGNISFIKTEMQKVPAFTNQACELVLQARKINASIPFQATLSRTYHDGEIRSTTIHGVYTATGYDSVGSRV